MILIKPICDFDLHQNINFGSAADARKRAVTVSSEHAPFPMSRTTGFDMKRYLSNIVVMVVSI